MSKQIDVTFLGHMCYDEITPFGGEPFVAPGSAVLCGAMVAGKLDKNVAAVVKMSAADDEICNTMRDLDIDVRVIDAPQTTYSQVIHPVEDVDVRQLILKKSAGHIKIDEVPQLDTKCMHLAGISDTEFTLELLQGLKQRGYSLSTDMQSFVRQVDPETKEISFGDVPQKKEIVALLDKVKLDIVEAEVLTGTRDLEKAAEIIASWGNVEVVITQAEGVLARVDGKTMYEKFSNKSVIGRTGRGDTTFAAYLCRRLDYSAPEALKFAAALVSVKMESIGPFNASLEEVLERMNTEHM